MIVLSRATDDSTCEVLHSLQVVYCHFHGNINSTIKTRANESAVTNTVKTPAHIPRGLVVRIRRSHRRGPGSIPGVGICFFLFTFSIPRANRNYKVIATFKTTETIQRDGQSFLSF